MARWKSKQTRQKAEICSADRLDTLSYEEEI